MGKSEGRRFDERLDDREHLALHNERNGFYQEVTSHEPGTEIVTVVVAGSREESGGTARLFKK